MNTPVVPVTAYMDLTTNDLEFIARHAKRIAKSLKKKYLGLGKDRWTAKRIEIPEKRVRFDETPYISIQFQRQQRDGTLVTEAILDAELTVLKPMSDDDLHLNGIPRNHNVKKRQLSLNYTLSRPTLRKEVAKEVRMTTAPSTARTLFDELAAAGFIETPDHRYIPLSVGTRNPATTGVIDNFPETQEEAPAKPVAKATQKRRTWSREEKFVREKTSALRREFLRQSGHIFKTVDFAVDPNTETFRLTFHAKKAFEGRYVVLEGKYNLAYDPKTRMADTFEFDVQKGSLRRDAAVPAIEPFDIMDVQAAAAIVFNTLSETRQLCLNPAAERAERAQRDARPHGKVRVASNRTERRLSHQRLAGIK